MRNDLCEYRIYLPIIGIRKIDTRANPLLELDVPQGNQGRVRSPSGSLNSLAVPGLLQTWT